MKRSRTEVGRWRMLRQVSRRKARWLEAQSRRNMRIHAIRKCGLNRHRNALLFAVRGHLKSMKGTVKVPIKHPRLSIFAVSFRLLSAIY